MAAAAAARSFLALADRYEPTAFVAGILRSLDYQARVPSRPTPLHQRHPACVCTPQSSPIPV